MCREKVLSESADITETGSLQWELVLCNMVCFAIVFAVLYKGIQSLGKVSTMVYNEGIFTNMKQVACAW